MQTDTNQVEDGQGIAHNPTKDTNDLDPYLDDPDTPTKEYVLKFDQCFIGTIIPARGTRV